jgi:hypothetical protein
VQSTRVWIDIDADINAIHEMDHGHPPESTGVSPLERSRREPHNSVHRNLHGASQISSAALGKCVL